jgi:2,4-dienoyl-CoA reductase-like NADH-dependent reductase (Old Yellow Enzyme family)
MPASTAELFTPFTLNGLALPNRIVMAPMTRNLSPNGVPGPDVAAYYRRRAEDGIGLIVTEGTTVDHPQAQNVPACPHIYGKESLAAWSRVVDGVKQAGGRIFCQLWHVGAVSQPGITPKLPAAPISPSGLLKPDIKVGEPMTPGEIDAVIEAFAQGAQAAQRVGFHGIEIHGAHGYLIDQFFWRGTNHRTDKYGGDLIGRTRFAVEIIQECRRRVGPQFPVILRFSQWKGQDYTAKLAATPDELARFLAPLSGAGLDGFHCSTRRFWEPEFEGSDLNLAGWTKKLTGKPTITVGSVSLNIDFLASFGGMEDPTSREGDGAGRANGIDRLLEMLGRGDFDLVAVGRAALADPAWSTKVRESRFSALKPFSLDVLKTLY